ncbi:hypothetical protein BJ994_002023 [Arthrobacter pigmenti]|uniref:Cobalamin-independent methionine synthase MetE C-terminal/archaeal domain-containing protein n=1 Tax=Arthrobacter pigmenti TaxID=271432 RepID=A0A846RS09_9MICC|nr:hypothetical protein [Arthrobacter pigmenti]NJC22947.1 hypothetical protein [Arthrobacter pigmenti]
MPDAVTVTAAGDWPGQDPAEAIRTIRGELGSPNLPFLPSLPQRGAGSDEVGRTAALLSELPVDLQPHGWRLVDRPGQDLRRAASALSTDLNVLADLVGAEADPTAGFKISCRGPLSMAANLYLHNGERALLDHGARRDIRDALVDGVVSLVRRTAAANPATELTVQLDEPEIADVLGGAIPTASGYRTLRAIPQHEVIEAWTAVAEAAQEAGAAVVVLSFRETEALQVLTRTPKVGFAVPVAGATGQDWEAIAELVEGGRQFWAALPVPVQRPVKVQDTTETLLRPWRGIGLPLSSLGAVRLLPAERLSEDGPDNARRMLRHLHSSADALNQAIADA